MECWRRGFRHWPTGRQRNVGRPPSLPTEFILKSFMNCKNILEYGTKLVLFTCIYEYMYIAFCWLMQQTNIWHSQYTLYNVAKYIYIAVIAVHFWCIYKSIYISKKKEKEKYCCSSGNIIFISAVTIPVSVWMDSYTERLHFRFILRNCEWLHESDEWEFLCMDDLLFRYS